MVDVNGWWGFLGNPLQFFYFIGLVSSGILVLQLLMNLMGMGGHDTDVADASSADDVPADAGGIDQADGADHSSGLGLLSVRTVVAFLVGFGWTGVVMLDNHNTLTMSVLVAVGVGFVFLLVVFWMMKAIYSLSESGNIDIKQAVGKTGNVYTPIPKQGEGNGMIQVIVQGRLRELTAMTDENEALPTGTPIRVIKVISENIMMVRRIKAGD